MFNQTRKQFSLMFVFVLMQIGIVAVQAATPPSPPPPPPPPSLTVTDNNAPEPPAFHWNQFNTTCSATVANAPQSTTETTVTGPHYQWSCSNPSPGFVVSNDDVASTSLLANPGSELTAGPNDVTVSCTATYSSTDKTTGVVTPIQVPGSTDVLFFVEKPVQVIQISNTNAPGSPYSGPNLYGHDQAYHLQVQDNHPNPQPYTNGKAREEKVTGTIYNGPAPASTAFGDYSTDPFGGKPAGVWDCSDFTDYIGCSTPQNLAALYGWNVITLQIAWDQKFWCDEPTGHNTPLNTFHIRNEYQTATRN